MTQFHCRAPPSTHWTGNSAHHFKPLSVWRNGPAPGAVSASSAPVYFCSLWVKCSGNTAPPPHRDLVAQSCLSQTPAVKLSVACFCTCGLTKHFNVGPSSLGLRLLSRDKEDVKTFYCESLNCTVTRCFCFINLIIYKVLRVHQPGCDS